MKRAYLRCPWRKVLERPPDLLGLVALFNLLSNFHDGVVRESRRGMMWEWRGKASTFK